MAFRPNNFRVESPLTEPAVEFRTQNLGGTGLRPSESSSNRPEYPLGPWKPSKIALWTFKNPQNSPLDLLKPHLTPLRAAGPSFGPSDTRVEPPDPYKTGSDPFDARLTDLTRILTRLTRARPRTDLFDLGAELFDRLLPSPGAYNILPRVDLTRPSRATFNRRVKLLPVSSGDFPPATLIISMRGTQPHVQIQFLTTTGKADGQTAHRLFPPSFKQRFRCRPTSPGESLGTSVLVSFTRTKPYA